MSIANRTAASAALAAWLALAVHSGGAHAQAPGGAYAGQQTRALGATLLDAERKPHALFARQVASAASIEAATREIGIGQARLRAEHLVTHVAQTALLDVHQVQRYSVLRGYADAKAAESAPGHSAPAPTHRQHH